MIPNISVVLITCNRAQSLVTALTSLLQQRLNDRWAYEVVVVNDGSKDDTAEQIQRLVARSDTPVQVVTTKGVGVPAARNLGVQAALGEWIACFDDDQIATPGWLNELRLMAERTGAECVGGALALRFDNGVSPQLGDRARKLLGEHLVGPSGPYPRGVLPASNNVLIARDLLLRVGGFDEAFRQGGSDTDLFERVQATGQILWFAARALAFHVIPPSRTQESYFRWVAMKVGATHARMLFKRRRRVQLAGTLAKRCAIFLLRDVPALGHSTLRPNAAARLDARCSLWFTEGLARGSAAYSMPQHTFAQRYFNQLDFRRHNGERPDNI